VISSSSQNPTPSLPEGKLLVLSTPGVEPRGTYAAIIFLDLEGRLLRTTLRANEELRFQILRTLSMLEPGGGVYFALSPAEGFLQSILRGNTLDAAQREIAERDAVSLPPNYLAALITGEKIDSVFELFSAVNGIEVIGPFLRNGRKTILLKSPKGERAEVIQLLVQINKVQSMRKEPLLSYRINPHSLN
jgi:primosomal protein N' (replication factor Y)